MEPTGIFEVFLRFGGAISLSAAAGWMWCLIKQRRMSRGPVWPYFASVITAIAVWRWILVALIYDELWPVGWVENLTAFVQPINAALYFLLGLSVIILVWGHLIGVKHVQQRRAKGLPDAGPYDEVRS